MAGNLTNEQRELILKQYWKTENLTPVDFFFWGTVKDNVFAHRPCTVENTSQFILKACQEIDVNKDLCSRVYMSVSS